MRVVYFMGISEDKVKRFGVKISILNMKENHSEDFMILRTRFGDMEEKESSMLIRKDVLLKFSGEESMEEFSREFSDSELDSLVSALEFYSPEDEDINKLSELSDKLFAITNNICTFAKQ